MEVRNGQAVSQSGRLGRPWKKGTVRRSVSQAGQAGHGRKERSGGQSVRPVRRVTVEVRNGQAVSQSGRSGGSG